MYLNVFNCQRNHLLQGNQSHFNLNRLFLLETLEFDHHLLKEHQLVFLQFDCHSTDLLIPLLNFNQNNPRHKAPFSSKNICFSNKRHLLQHFQFSLSIGYFSKSFNLIPNQISQLL